MAAKKPAKKTPAKKKVVAKKAPARKKVAAKKAPAKKAAAPARKVTAIQQRFTKTQTLTEISNNTGLTKKQVSSVLDELGIVIERHIKKRGAGEFTLPGLMKIKTVKKPARKARKGVNPFTGEETTFKARPASTAVKILPLKALKDMAN